MSDDILHLTADLYTFVLKAEHLTSKHKLAPNRRQFRSVAEDLRDRFAQVKEEAGTRIHDRVENIRHNLRDIGEELIKQQPSTKLLRNQWASLGRDYESLVFLLQKTSRKLPVAVPHFKPRNYSRNLFHLLNSLWAVVLYQFVLEKPAILGIAGGFLVLILGIEIVRRLSPAWNDRFCNGIFGAVSRPHEEHSITAGTWYTIALCIGILTMPRDAICAGTLLLGVGDPIASIVGKAWGKRKLWNGKSLEGTLAFALLGTGSLLLLFSFARPDLTFGISLLLCSAIAVSGALTELFTGRLEDNFTIPLVSGLVATLGLSLL